MRKIKEIEIIEWLESNIDDFNIEEQKGLEELYDAAISDFMAEEWQIEELIETINKNL
jgi:hypothetical protein